MDSVTRIIDANLNRAREGLRVMEDVARFHLGRADLCDPIKHIRHGLQEACRMAGLDELELTASRDAAGDVGTGIKTATEAARGSLRDAAVAAGKRVGEALRTIEESLKIRVSQPGFAEKYLKSRAPSAVEGPFRVVEQLRYKLYDVEKALIAAMAAGPSALSGRRCPQWRLCVLITESLCKRPWWEVAHLARMGGADCLQLREKDLPAKELLIRAKRLVEIGTKELRPDGWAVGHGVIDEEVPPCHVIINDRPDIAAACGAHGVHLGRDDMPIEAARSVVGPRMWIGASTHALFEATSAVQAGADYCGVGAMFAGTTKARAPSGPATLRQYLADPRVGPVPHLAIGGITAANVGELVAVGCRGVAVSSAVCGSDEPGRACVEILRALGP